MGKQAMLQMGISHSTTGEQWHLCQLHREAEDSTLNGKEAVEVETPDCPRLVL